MENNNVKTLPQVGFVEATKNGFKNLFNFKGRIRRSEYWWFMSVVVTIWLVIVLLFWETASFWHKPIKELQNAEIILCLVSCVVFGVIPVLLSISSQVRRFHDIGKNSLLPVLAGVAWLSSVISFVALLASEWIYIHEDLIPNDQVGIEVFMVLFFISIIMMFVILFYTVRDSDRDANKYGASPKYIKD